MPWEIVTSASTDADPGTAHFKRKLLENIRTHFDKLDTVCAQWRRGSKWIPVPFAIALPKDAKQRKTSSPEEGADLMWSRTIACETEHEAKEVRFEGFGSSASGDSELRLFHFSCKPFEANEEEAKTSKEKLDNVAIEAANVMKDLCAQLGTHLEKHHGRELSILDKAIALVEKNTATTEQFVIGLGHARQMQQDTYEHEERMQAEANSAASFERVTNTFGGTLSSLLERWLSQKFNLDGSTLKGSFAQRLLAVINMVDALPDGNARLQKMHEILGDEAWSVLQAMSRATTTDDAFRAQGERFLELLGEDAKQKLQQIAMVAGEGPALALLKLIHDAGLL